MGYRDRSTSERSGGYDYCMMEVRLRKKGAPLTAKEDLRVLMVDSHWETLQYVQEHMEEYIGNVVRMRRLEANTAKGVKESAEMFAKKLEPIMTSLAATNGEGVMDKLSISLKKALLLMVMERYQSDRETACRVLGISQEKLDIELKRCGVSR